MGRWEAAGNESGKEWQDWAVKNCELFFFFLGLHFQHMEVLRLGVKSELQLPAYTTAMAAWDLSHICDNPQLYP